MLRVLALASYPEAAAATRYRLLQMVAPLARVGIELEVRPFLSATAFAALYAPSSSKTAIAGSIATAMVRRLRDVVDAGRFDLVLVQREAAIAGPPVVEVLATGRRRPLVLDLDDPTWIAYDSPTFGGLARALRWTGKTNTLIERASLVTCGGSAIADYVRARGGSAAIVPTVVDTDVFTPRTDGADPVPTVGWIGSHSTYPYLEAILPSLRTASLEVRFRLLVVGAPPGAAVDGAGLEVEVRPWALDREVADFQAIDVGLYPMPDDAWARGKSGFKAIQYLAVGAPYVASPVGAVNEIGSEGETHLLADSSEAWTDHVVTLCHDAALRRSMSRAARRFSLAHYTVAATAERLAEALRSAA